MCFDNDSSPPIDGAEAVGVSGEAIVLTADDGARFAAYAARPARPGDIGVLVLPDNRGLRGFYRELARHFARQGFNAVAIDYFGRTAGLGERDDDFPFRDHLRQLSQEGLQADQLAAVNHLRSEAGGGCDRLFSVGFCFGGRQSFFSAAWGNGLSGAVGFYGFPGALMGAPGPIDSAAAISAPILALWGGADTLIPRTDIDAFDVALGAAGVEREMVTYPGAPHGFFDRKQEEFAEASADAWRRVLEFIRHHAGSAVPAAQP